MAVKGGPDIETDGLVFNLDAAGAVSDKGYPINGLSVEYLIVAGGGAGGNRLGGGGGAGGILRGNASLSLQSYTITVGGGAASMTSQTGGVGSNGSNSSGFGQIAIGGGGGGGFNGASYIAAASGGSGGGAASNGGATPGAATSGQGTAGRGGIRSNILSNLPVGWSTDNGYVSGGGGGASSQGSVVVGVGSTQNPATAKPGNGGDGILSYITGSATYYGGGGGGHQYRNSYTNAVGGLGGGGRGGAGGYSAGQIAYTTPTNGETNTGGGGGGGGYYSGEGGSSGSGGSGVVIIRYKGSQKASGGDSIFNYRGFTVHVFTSSGTFTVGGRIADLSTSKIVGTLNNMGSSNYSSANRGYFTFDGSNEYIDLPTINVNTTANTVCAWARKANTDGGFHNIYTPWSNGFDNWLGAYTNKWFLFVTQAADTGNVFVYSNSTITANTWYFISSTVDSNVAKLYVNGELNFTVSLGFTIGSWNAAASIGRRATISNYYWEGDIASISVYNYGLSAKEILDSYNATKGRFGL